PVYRRCTTAGRRGGFRGVAPRVNTANTVGDGAAGAPVPAGVDLAGLPQVPAVEVGPQRVQKDQFGVVRLPDEEVRGPVLAGRAHEQVDVRHFRFVQVAGEQLLVHLVRADLARGHIGGDRGGRVGDLG